MAQQIRFIILLIATVVIALPNSEAQTGSELDLDFKFTVFSPDHLGNFAYEAKTKPILKLNGLKFYPTSRSPRYHYRGKGPLTFRDMNTREVVAVADIPEGMKDLLLIFIPIQPEPSAGLRYQVVIYDDTKTVNSARGLGVLNFSGLSLTGEIGSDSVQIHSGYNGPYQIGKSSKVTLRTTINKRSYQSYSDAIALGANGRALLLLFPPYYRGSIEVQSRVLYDEIEPNKKDG